MDIAWEKWRDVMLKAIVTFIPILKVRLEPKSASRIGPRYIRAEKKA